MRSSAVSGLRVRDVRHVTLMASEAVLRDRFERSEEVAAAEWRAKHVLPCLTALRSPRRGLDFIVPLFGEFLRDNHPVE